jgi:Restriction alleviation protein Lar
MPVAIIKGVDLKTCPFCGSQAVLKADNGTFKKDPEPLYAWAKCTNRDCGISTKSVASHDQAVALWNGRK